MTMLESAPGSAEFVISRLTIRGKLCPHSPKIALNTSSDVPSCLGFFYQNQSILLILKTSCLCRTCYDNAVPSGYNVFRTPHEISTSTSRDPSILKGGVRWWEFRTIGLELYGLSDVVRLPLSTSSQEHQALELFSKQCRPCYMTVFLTMGKFAPKSLQDRDISIVATQEKAENSLRADSAIIEEPRKNEAQPSWKIERSLGSSTGRGEEVTQTERIERSRTASAKKPSFGDSVHPGGARNMRRKTSMSSHKDVPSSKAMPLRSGVPSSDQTGNLSLALGFQPQNQKQDFVDQRPLASRPVQRNPTLLSAPISDKAMKSLSVGKESSGSMNAIRLSPRTSVAHGTFSKTEEIAKAQMTGASSKGLQFQPRNRVSFPEMRPQGTSLGVNSTTDAERSNATTPSRVETGRSSISHRLQQTAVSPRGVTSCERLKWKSQAAGAPTRGFAPSNPIPQRQTISQETAGTSDSAGIPVMPDFISQKTTRDGGLFRNNDLRPSNPLMSKDSPKDSMSGAPVPVRKNRFQSQTAFREGRNIGMATKFNAGQYKAPVQGRGNEMLTGSYGMGLQHRQMPRVISHGNIQGHSSIHNPTMTHSQPADHHKSMHDLETKAEESSQTEEIRDLSDTLKDMKDKLKESNENTEHKERSEKSRNDIENRVDGPGPSDSNKKAETADHDDNAGLAECSAAGALAGFLAADETDEDQDVKFESNSTGQQEEIDSLNIDDDQGRNSDSSEAQEQEYDDSQIGNELPDNRLFNIDNSLEVSEEEDFPPEDNDRTAEDKMHSLEDEEEPEISQDSDLFYDEDPFPPEMDAEDSVDFNEDIEQPNINDLFGESCNNANEVYEEQGSLFADPGMSDELMELGDEEETGDPDILFENNDDQAAEEENEFFAEPEMEIEDGDGGFEADNKDEEEDIDNIFGTNSQEEEEEENDLFPEFDAELNEFETGLEGETEERRADLFQHGEVGDLAYNDGLDEGQQGVFDSTFDDDHEIDNEQEDLANIFDQDEGVEEEQGGLDHILNDDDQDQDQMIDFMDPDFELHDGFGDPPRDETTFGFEDEDLDAAENDCNDSLGAEDETQSFDLEDDNEIEDPFQEEVESQDFDLDETGAPEDNLDYLDEDINENTSLSQEELDAGFEEDQELDGPLAIDNFDDGIGDNTSETNDLYEDPLADQDLDIGLDDPAIDNALANDFDEGLDNNELTNNDDLLEDNEVDVSNDCDDPLAEDDLYGSQYDNIVGTSGDLDNAALNDEFQDGLGETYEDDYDNEGMEGHGAGDMEDFGNYGTDIGMDYEGGETIEDGGDLGYSAGYVEGESYE